MTGLAASARGLAGAAGETPPPPPPPGVASRQTNLVLFMPDEMRADSLACYGNPLTRTPNFDRLAREGTRFSNCHVQFPVCGASRCSLLTGWPPSVRGHRRLYYFLRPEEPNLFRYLRQAGYDVFWFGKNDALAAESFSASVTRWQDVNEMQALAAFRSVHSLTPGALSMLYSPGGDRRQVPDYQCLQNAIEVLERKQSERPFCIFLPLLEPHPPYTVPADFHGMYSPADVPAPVPAGLDGKPAFHRAIRDAYGLAKMSEADYRRLRAVYYGQVSYSDWLLGELMEALERTGRDKDTALFAFSDHGDYAGDYGLIEKWPSGLEDCLTHVPLIARVPGGAAGTVAEEMVELYDVMATSLELAGTAAAHTHFARSLAPQLGGGKGDAGRAAFAEGGYNVYEPQCFEPAGAGPGPYAAKIGLQTERPEPVSRSAMIRTRTHKLIVRPQGESELYSYADDPEERRNLFYGDRSTAGLQAELQTRLLEHFINTTGIAPFDKDSRNSPPYYPTPANLTPAGWQAAILDRGAEKHPDEK
jgi:choline-sulfatase